jgi:hypothetical protein
MERELAEEAAPVAWGEVDADELVRKEQRRGVLPRLIAAAKIKRLELEKQRTERELEPLYTEREDAHRKLERAQAKKLKAEEEMLEARAAWSYPHGLIEKRERRLKDLDRQIAVLQGDSEWTENSASKQTGRSGRSSWSVWRPTGGLPSRTSWGGVMSKSLSPSPMNLGARMNRRPPIAVGVGYP